MSPERPGGEDPRERSRRIPGEVDEEIRFHLEMRGDELEAGGLEPSAAREEALRRFGDLAATRRAMIASDRVRERSVVRKEYLDEVVQDLRHGARQLRNRPLFALAAVVTLAVGIGATTAIFGAADHMLMRPLPYRDAKHVVTLWEVDLASRESKKEVSPGNFLDWKDRSSSFASMGIAEPSGFDLTGDGPPEPVAAWRVSEGFCEALGVTPALGRSFHREEFQPNAAPAVMISHGLWQRRFASDPTLVGRAIRLDDQSVTLVGVLPPGLPYPQAKDVWAPKSFREDEKVDRRSSYMLAVARLRPGVSIRRASADLGRIASQLAGEHPRSNGNAGVRILALEDHVLGPVRPALLVLLGAVTLMLLIACANVAGLVLARGAEREPELAVRSALGAAPARLMRQLLTESLLLATLGGVAGLALAWWGSRLLMAASPAWLPRADTIAIDGRVLAFSLVLTLGSALLFGLVPALRFSRPDASLAHAGARVTPARDRARLRSGLVVAEIALALVLVMGAGLLIRSFVTLVSNDVGFAVEHRLSLQLFLWDRAPTPEQRLQRADEIAARFKSVPGVADVGVVTALPFHPSQIDARGALVIEGRPMPPTDAEAQAYTTVASPEYFRIMGVPLLQGRPFEARDRMDAPRVALVNEALARRYFPGESPIGKRVTFGVMGKPERREIVGVVGNVRPTTLDSDPRAEIYVPFAQSANGGVTFVVRCTGDPDRMLPVLRKKVWEIDPNQSIYHAATVRELISATLVERRFHLLLLTVFSVIALSLAGVGIYGLVSVMTSQRTHEIGVRMALGARSVDIVRLILGQGVRLVVPGVVIGLAGGLFLTRFLAQMLYRVHPGDPATCAEVAVVMVLVALVGTLVPAMRAAVTDPVRALRQE